MYSWWNDGESEAVRLGRAEVEGVMTDHIELMPFFAREDGSLDGFLPKAT